MEFRTKMYVDDDQNIVTEIKMIQTPTEFLTANAQVMNFAQMMRPGAGIPQQAHRLTVDK